MMNSGIGAGGTRLPVPRVYLKINRKSCRDGLVEDAPASQYVRVQWDAAEMGALPAPLQRALATRTKYLFRRLPDPAKKAAASGCGDTAVTPSETSECATAVTTLSAPARTPVERVTQAGQCVLIECGGGGEAGAADTSAAASPAAMALYVLDTRASERQAMEEAFGEFAVTDDTPAGYDAVKRARDTTDDVADVYLAPVRRLSRGQDHATAPQAEEVAPSISCWGPVEEDVAGTTWEMLQAYEELLCVESGGEGAADLYCYPDHRKDDEYDSNAEDFSGNDYPNDADEGSERSSSGGEGEGSESSTWRRGRRGHGCAAYGMFCEEGYRERSLSSGWSSDDN
ncbi:hypothetical protein ABB37_07651 [Leptomonas pyrrhocoris]|uniref:Transcription factor Iwr1 domain-containing protein n=1 Tax=Leptomonas pyrrhocoris TaxID=157538 RepID=A0A0M9FVI4_LEPPY|nr:hypothetical protein ABB37_07651 [Leptomonas pyrrhocoris]XP_015655293.1 hypothetical protein ABB37_07651 [Leptomonas pyrrhocoris]KPA76853.1 hypothetical protein ABB37_07651 [Leptomonas pyrrhocoris]KPA76854.1 hypothetical protein ABB37_07651 [Leptomonas pyrrhocoris]|eukprot:XP_015655292.1 hypothetical protein ABB37_07651 [Leptomonas pyrrhocoris]